MKDLQIAAPTAQQKTTAKRVHSLNDSRNRFSGDRWSAGVLCD
jgi:hypothetical protein